MDGPKEGQVQENTQVSLSPEDAQIPEAGSQSTDKEKSPAIGDAQKFDIEEFCQEMMVYVEAPAIENSAPQNEASQASANAENEAETETTCQNEEVAGAAAEAPQPRGFRNLADILRHAAQTSTGTAEAAQQVVSQPSCGQVNAQAMGFLFDALTAVDAIEEMNKSIKFLQGVPSLSEGDEYEYVDALDKIFELICNIDNANDFHKIGGFGVLKSCLESAFSFVRWRAAEVIAELCQNNPYCQKHILECGFLTHLLLMVETDEDFIARTKALFAVSCIIRNHEEAYKEFVDFDGFSVLLRALQVEDEKLNIKCAFLICSLIQWKPKIKADLVNMGFIEVLVKQLDTYIKRSHSKHLACTEHFLNTIVGLVTNNTKGLEVARKPDLRLRPLLDTIVEQSEGMDQYLEEYEAAILLAGMVFFHCNVSEEER